MFSKWFGSAIFGAFIVSFGELNLLCLALCLRNNSSQMWVQVPQTCSQCGLANLVAKRLFNIIWQFKKKNCFFLCPSAKAILFRACRGSVMLEVCHAQRQPVELCQNPDCVEKLVCLFPCGAILLLWLAVTSPDHLAWSLASSTMDPNVEEHYCREENMNNFILCKWLLPKILPALNVA